MKAVIITGYGGNDVVEVADQPRPLPGPTEVLIRVHAAGVNPVDWKVRSGMARFFTGGRFPKVIGCECAGEVAEAGGSVRLFRPGDRVIGTPGVRRLGAYAEYACVDEALTFAMPGNIPFEQAASIPIAGLTALQALRDHGRITPGMKVLINGASGGVGHFAVQIAKRFDVEVTAVCSKAKESFVRELGADRVVDYEQEDFAASGGTYDIVFDAVSTRSFGECRKALAPHGVYVNTLPNRTVIDQVLTALLPGRKARSMWVKPNRPDMDWLQEHIEAGGIRVVLDRTFSLEQVRDAFAYSETGRARGKIALTISGAGASQARTRKEGA